MTILLTVSPLASIAFLLTTSDKFAIMPALFIGPYHGTGPFGEPSSFGSELLWPYVPLIPCALLRAVV